MSSQVTQFKDITIAYDATATVTLKFYTDMPSGGLSLRRTVTFASTSGRAVATKPFDDSGNSYALVEGRIYKVRVECSGGVCRLFWGKIRARKIGVYIDGANGEIWETLELSI